MSYVIYAQGYRAPDQYRRTHVVVFSNASQAKVWLSIMERGLPEGYTLKSNQLEEIREAPETSWQLPDRYRQWILRFKYGTWDELPIKDEPVAEDALRSKHSRRAQCPDGYVTITALCASSNVSASDARAILRASLVKPEYGWCFSPTEVPKIKKLCSMN